MYILNQYKAMKKIFFAAVAAISVMACTGKNTVLDGIVPEGSDKQVKVMIRSLKLDTLITPANGRFSVNLPVDDKLMAVAHYDGRSAQFILDGSRVSIDFTTEEKPLCAKGKGANEAYAEYVRWNADYRSRYPAAPVEERPALMDEYRDKMKEIAAANNNVLGLIAVKSLKPLLDPTEMREFVAGLDPAISEDEGILSMLEIVAAQEATSPGKMFIDFEITQPDGTVKKLSDYVGKGKYILADFWASWCGPCRREIPNLKNVYSKFHGEQFDIVSVAVWDKPENTLKAIAEEEMPWNQIIDCQKIPGELYGIEGIPEMILFGPDGTILNRGGELRGDRMEPAIAKYIK